MSYKYRHEWRALEMPSNGPRIGLAGGMAPDPEALAHRITAQEADGFMLHPTQPVPGVLLFMRSTRVLDDERVSEVMGTLEGEISGTLDITATCSYPLSDDPAIQKLGGDDAIRHIVRRTLEIS